MFPKFTDNGIRYPVSQTMEIELGLLAAVALMGGAVQRRLVGVLQRKLKEIKADQERGLNVEAEAAAAERFDETMREQEEWEKEHPNMHGRKDSSFSGMTAVVAPTKSTDEKRDSTFTLVGADRRPQLLSAGPSAPGAQTPGALPALDLGSGIENEVPQTFIAAPRPPSPALETLTPAQLEEIKRKESLVAEIQTIRKSIEVLKSETSSASQSRRASIHLDEFMPSTSHLRPPRETDSRARVRSMDGISYVGETIPRPTSVPLRDNNWDAYVRDRKLLQPPAGISAPIAPSPVPVRAPLPAAVTEAITQRKRRESQLESSPSGSSDDIPLGHLRPQGNQGKRHSQLPASSSALPAPAAMNILPPRRVSPPLAAPVPRHPEPIRTRTFEELTQRHREKMHALQAPLSQAEREQADLEASKSRWERAKAIEKEATLKRQADQAKQAAKAAKRKSAGVMDEEGVKRESQMNPSPSSRHSRSLSADKLGGPTSPSSRRLSTMKVEDWRQYQKDTESGIRMDRRKSVGRTPPS